MKATQIYIVLIAIVVFGCKKPDDKQEFDRKGMLANMYSNVISPAITNLDSELTNLNEKSSGYTTTPTLSTLEDLKTAFTATYLAFQKIKPFNFGPIDDYGVIVSMNTYPTDTIKIVTNISSGSYILGSSSNVNAIGLPAIDYLLFHGSSDQIIEQFTSDPNAENRKNYLNALVSKMNTDLASAKTGWNSYQTTFKDADGNDIGGSTSILFNSFVKDIELIKNAKIGIPAGFQTSGQTLPSYTEAYFSGLSIQLAVENIKSLQTIFNGASGAGFDDYIKDVEDETVVVSLADNINLQFETCISKLNAIGEPLSDKVNSNPTALSEAWQEIKKLITYSKTDMSSILGLLITFQDNDGD